MEEISESTFASVTSAKNSVCVPQSRVSITLPESSALTDSVRTDTVDLGRIHAGEVIHRDLSLRNGSDRPMIILSAATNCGCTTVDFEREPVQPGAEAGFVFEFDSKGFSGYQLKHITLRTTLSKQPFTLVVIGEVE